MKPISVTAETSHAERSWLKAVAKQNMYPISVTAETSHAERSWLKAEAPASMQPISVTAETSHAERSWLKAVREKNMSYISVTAETSHAPIGLRVRVNPMAEPPCCPGQRPSGDSAMHASTAALSALRDVKTGTAARRATYNESGGGGE